MMGSFLFKQKAREALRGNWQNALVVTFFSGALITLASVMQQKVLEKVQRVSSSLMELLYGAGSEITNEQMLQIYELTGKYFDELNKIPRNVWIALLVVNLLALVITPALRLSCNKYFICLNNGENIGVSEGLTGRLNMLFKAAWLYVRMFVQSFLWSMLFVIPGIVATVRYSMAPYFMAEDPSLSAGEALKKSDAVMKGNKGSYFMLMISFVGWSLLISVVQTLLGGMLGPVVMLVAAQFMTLALDVYINASSAAFYHTVSKENGLSELVGVMRRRMQQAGISEMDINASGFGERDVIIDENQEDETNEQTEAENADGGQEE